MKLTLKKSEVLKNKKEISSLFENGKWNKGRYVNIVSCPAEDRKVLFATARHLKGAVTRNRGKRYLRECYRNHKEWFSSLHMYGLILKKIPDDRPLEKILTDLQVQLHHD